MDLSTPAGSELESTCLCLVGPSERISLKTPGLKLRKADAGGGGAGMIGELEPTVDQEGEHMAWRDMSKGRSNGTSGAFISLLRTWLSVGSGYGTAGYWMRFDGVTGLLKL